jgi:photosystem II stability/assembly factor-like uncharacterized protein
MSTSGGNAGSTAQGGSAGPAGGTSGSGGASGKGGPPGNGGASGGGGASVDGGKMGSGGIVGADASTGGPCGSIPARGTWDAASVSPVAAPPGEPGYQFKGKSVSVVVDPFDTAKVWLGTGEYGLYQSTDCGASWKHVSTGTNGSQIDKSTLWSMAVDPVNKGTIYTVAAYGAGSVWKSTNGGVDWVDLFPNQTKFQYNFANNVSMDAHDPQHLVTMSHGSCDDFSNGCLTETFDGGKTWPNRASLPKPWGERGGVDVIDKTTWILGYGGDGMYVTTDNGKSWKQTTQRGAGDATGEFSILPLAPAADGAYYVDSFQGALRSTDGINWSLAWGKKNGVYARLEALITTPTMIYAGDNADMYSAPLSDYGNWTKMTGPKVDNFFNTFMAYDPVHKVVYVSGWEGGMVRYVEP